MNLGQSSFLFAAFAALCSAATAATPLKICDDEAGWPPYTFADPKNPKAIVGASAELLVDILKRAGYEPQITLLPWKRCLAEVERGTMSMLMNAAYSEERAQKYLMSTPYYSVHSALFYRNSKYPVAPKLAAVADMKQYRYCGLFGYNYTMYDIPPTQMDTGSKDEWTRFAKLRHDRCDFALGDVEVLNGFVAMGQLDLSAVSHIPIPGDKPKDFYALVTRAPSGGEKLLKVLNDGIAAAKADKSYTRIFKKYGI